MTGGPPGDGPSPWEDVLSQIGEALDDAGIAAGPTRSALLDALGGALDQLASMDIFGERRDARSDGPGTPEVTVVDGGRGRDQPRSRKPRPKLRVAEGDADLDEGVDASVIVGIGLCEECQAALSGAGIEMEADFGAYPEGGEAGGALSVFGWIDLEPDEEQVLYAGSEARPYRVFCEEGALILSGDGAQLALLRRGQSTDIHAAHIAVAGTSRAAAGRYLRLDESAPPF